MAEYEIKGKKIKGPFIGSERNALKLLWKMGMEVEKVFFIYKSIYPEAEGCLKFNRFGYSINYDGIETNPFDKIKNIAEPFESMNIEIEPANIMFYKERFGLNEKGYVFYGFEYHPSKTGLHISANRDRNETTAGMPKNKNYRKINKFKEAMESLGFGELKIETKKHKVISMSEFIG